MTLKSDLVLEILNEEIPSRMQAQAVENFKSSFTKKLNDYGLNFDGASCYITPRRIAIHVREIPVVQQDRTEEKRGPRVDAPEQAIQGFLASSGFTSLDECEKRSTDKGEFWYAMKFIKGLETKDIIPKIINEVITEFTWPKSMRWGKNTLSWVRPIRSIFCLFDNTPVHGHLSLGDDFIPFGASTKGHRFLSRGDLTPEDYKSYREFLSENYVILDHHERRGVIERGIFALAEKNRYRVRQDTGLVDEVTGLVEWPVPLMGKIDPAFMHLPEEVLITSMRVHQRYFALEDKHGKLAPNFILVANVIPTDGGTALILGNERVLRARLSDAKFFFEQDKQNNLETIGKGLSQAIFQDELGTMADKVSRMMAVSAYLAGHLSMDARQAKRAAQLSKSDLMSHMVGEFPELQGIMGYYYSLNDEEDQIVAEAIADQYKPKGFQDDMPRSTVGQIVALADKIDTIVGFFAIGIKPTGSKDPYALRRSAIGCIRLLETLKGLSIDGLVANSYNAYAPIFAKIKKVSPLTQVIAELKEFFFDRLKAYWREKGVPHDYLDAVFAVAENDAFEVIALRVEALKAFLTRVDGSGEKLLAAYRRASNIVRIEEKKDGVVYKPVVSDALLEDAAEKNLYKALIDSKSFIEKDMENNDFQKVMAALAELRPYIDIFFDKVTVNADNKALRENRLKLLSLIRSTLHQVADFSKIEG
jgi:glycyl-tRNA synthetase beta chain